MTERFCGACGEQRAGDRHYTLWHFVEEALETFLHADGRLLRTLRTLIVRPGELTAAYMRGERKPYVGPLQLFLLVNLGYFLLAGITGANTFATPLQYHINGVAYSDLARHAVDARLIARHVSLATYAAAFDHTAAVQAKSLLLVMALLLAAATAVVMLPRRAYAVQYLVFGLHLMAALLILLVVASLPIELVLSVARHLTGTDLSQQVRDNAESLVIIGLLCLYAARAIVRSFRVGRIEGTVRAVLVCVTLAGSLLTYRAILFVVTYLSV